MPPHLLTELGQKYAATRPGELEFDEFVQLIVEWSEVRLDEDIGRVSQRRVLVGASSRPRSRARARREPPHRAPRFGAPCASRCAGASSMAVCASAPLACV